MVSVLDLPSAMKTIPALDKLPEDVLIQIASQLNAADLISFSFTFRLCYQLSLSSATFWKHDVVPGLIDTGSVVRDDEQTNVHRQAALRSWRLRKVISSDREMIVRVTKEIEFDGAQIYEVIIPGTHYLLALSQEANLICIDLHQGVTVDILGDIEPNAFLVDAKVGPTGNFHILIAGSEPHCEMFGGSNAYVFAVYEGVLTEATPNEPQALEIKRVARKLFRKGDLGSIRKLAIEGYNIIAETGVFLFGYGQSPPVFLVIDWNPAKPVRQPAIWEGPRGHHMFAWQAAGDYLLITYFKNGLGSMLYALAFETLYQPPRSSIAPPATRFPAFEAAPLTGVYRLVADRLDAKESGDVLDVPMVLMGLASDVRGHGASRVYRLPARILYKEPIYRQPMEGMSQLPSNEENPHSTTSNDGSSTPTESKIGYYGGVKVEFPDPSCLLNFPSPQYINTARLSNGIFWGLCDQRERIMESEVRSMHFIELHVCDINVPEGLGRSLKRIKDIPEGSAHVVDMDVGVVCIVQSGAPKPAKEEQESDIETTRISVQWYS